MTRPGIEPRSPGPLAKDKKKKTIITSLTYPSYTQNVRWSLEKVKDVDMLLLKSISDTGNEKQTASSGGPRY